MTIAEKIAQRLREAGERAVHVFTAAEHCSNLGERLDAEVERAFLDAGLREAVTAMELKRGCNCYWCRDCAAALAKLAGTEVE